MEIWIFDETRITRVSCSVFAAALFFLFASPANGQAAPAAALKQTPPPTQAVPPQTQVSVEALLQQLAKASQLVTTLQNEQRATEAKLKETQSAFNAQSKRQSELVAKVQELEKALASEQANLQDLEKSQTKQQSELVTKLKEAQSALGVQSKQRSELEAKVNQLEQALAAEKRTLGSTQAKLQDLEKSQNKSVATPPAATKTVSPSPVPAPGVSWKAALFGGVAIAGLGGVLGLGLGWGMARTPRFAKPFLPTPDFKVSVDSRPDMPDWTIASTKGDNATEPIRSLGLRCQLEIGDVDAPSSVRVVKEKRDERA